MKSKSIKNSHVVMHELGHALYRETLAGIADKKIYKRLYADFEKTRASFEKPCGNFDKKDSPNI